MLARGEAGMSQPLQIVAEVTETTGAVLAEAEAADRAARAADEVNLRSPVAGMFLRVRLNRLAAAAEHHIDLPNSWMIGDSESDREAGTRAGCRTVTISDQSLPVEDAFQDLRAESLLAAAKKIVSLAETLPSS